MLRRPWINAPPPRHPTLHPQSYHAPIPLLYPSLSGHHLPSMTIGQPKLYGVPQRRRGRGLVQQCKRFSTLSKPKVSTNSKEAFMTWFSPFSPKTSLSSPLTAHKTKIYFLADGIVVRGSLPLPHPRAGTAGMGIWW